MAGKDVREDMVAENIGVRVLTNHFISKSDKDISRCPNGKFDEHISFLSNL